MNAKNAKTGKEYNGQNAEILARMAIGRKYRHNTWATYKQWHDSGFQVQKGEKGVKIMALNITEKENKKEVKGVNFYTVFNIAQVKRIEATA